MRISDWSSDVCSSDLQAAALSRGRRGGSIHCGSERQPLSRAGISSEGVGRQNRYPCPYSQPWARSVIACSGVSTPSATTLMPRLRPRLTIAATIAASSLRCATSRSEEHTSELQSLMRIPYAVFCLKKKNHHERNKE